MRTILEHIFAHASRGVKTNGAVALERLMSMKNRNAAVFVISDCIDDRMDDALRMAARIYELVVIRCLDPLERHLPSVGFLNVHDPETGIECVIDTRKRSGRHVRSFLDHRAGQQGMLYTKYGVGCFDLANSETFVGDVVRFFRRRMAY